jgi:hypothetical protein
MQFSFQFYFAVIILFDSTKKQMIAMLQGGNESVVANEIKAAVIILFLVLRCSLHVIK